jgi:hypothetical protein
MNVRLSRIYNVEQDIVEVFIEAAEHKRRPIFLNSYDFGGQTAVCGFSPRANLKHYLQVSAFSQREVFGFDKGTVNADMSEPALR